MIPNRKGGGVAKGLAPEELTNEQIYEWMGKASNREINIFDDHNKIIKVLCQALLESRRIDPMSGKEG